MLWNELVKVALLGTDRAQLSAKTLQQLEELGVDTAEAPERVLLEGAAIASSMQKAGLPLETWKEPIPLASEPDQTIPPGKTIAALLSQIIRWENEDLLVDFLNQLAHSNRRLPLEHLPYLMERLLRTPSLWSLIDPVLGKKGAWAIRQHPEWRTQIEMPLPAQWSAGAKPQRRALLKAVRERSPEEGIELLRSEWEKETPADKAYFLKLLHAQLSSTDEDFLEECLDDRRKEVRNEAAYLLGYLPYSALVRRMKDRLATLIVMKSLKNGKWKMEITLPEQYDNVWIRDGLNLKLQWPKGGIKASRLWQMLAVVPPVYWLEKFEVPPGELLKISPSSDWGSVFLQGIIDALAKHPHPGWTEAILTTWIKQYDDLFWETINITPLLPNISNEFFNTICLAAMRKTEESISEEEPAALLLQLEGQIWSEEVSRMASRKTQEWIAAEGYGFSLTPHYKNILKRAAYAIPPSLFETISRIWRQSTRYWPGWEREVQLFLATLGFRKKMYEEMRKNGNP